MATKNDKLIEVTVDEERALARRVKETEQDLRARLTYLGIPVSKVDAKWDCGKMIVPQLGKIELKGEVTVARHVPYVYGTFIPAKGKQSARTISTAEIAKQIKTAYVKAGNEIKHHPRLVAKASGKASGKAKTTKKASKKQTKRTNR